MRNIVGLKQRGCKYMEKEYFVMDDGGMDISIDEIPPEAEEIMNAAFEEAMKEIQSQIPPNRKG